VSGERRPTIETPTAGGISELAILLQSGRYGDAEDRARELLAQHPDSCFAWKALGICLWKQGRDARPAFENAIRLSPADAEAHGNLASVLQGAGQLDEAVESWRRASALEPDWAEAHANMAQVLFSLGRIEEAVASYRRAIEARPTLAALHNNLGSALLELGQIPEAVASYRRALQIKQRYPEAHSNLGNALRCLGQFAQAAESSRRAIELRPRFAEAHNNLGNALRCLKQPRLALESYRQALAIRPDFAEAHANAGDALLDLCDVDEAVTSYRRALELKPNYAEAHGKLGHVLSQRWQFADSVASYRRALEIKPEFPQALNGLGCALLEFGVGEAESAFREALQLKPDFAEALNNLAQTLRMRNRGAEAEETCHMALELDPGLIPAMALLAELRADRGAFEEAEQLYRRAIAIDAESPTAWAGIAHLRRMERTDSEWLCEAQRIADKQPLPRAEAQLRYALGKYFDDVGDFDQAFSNYRRANDLGKSYRRKYDRLDQHQRMDRIMRHYDSQWLSRARPDASQSSRPIFLVGLPRTGTTLAEQVLASHPATFGAGTLSFWTRAAAAHARQMSTDDPRAELVGELAGEYLRQLEELSPGSLRVVDKATTNFACLGLIHAVFPNAHIMHMRRNPIDTCLSNYFDFSSRHAHVHDLEDMAHFYREYSRLMEHWRCVLPPGSILDVPYEGLVQDQETWTRRMLEFVGLPWDAKCIEFARTERRVITASKWQVRQNMNSRSVDRWRNYAAFIAPLLSLPADTEMLGRPGV
jgi:tetratricopeptide (TPR) repeat protein